MAGGIFAALIPVYYELLFHLWIGGSFTMQTIALVFFALALGGVLGALISLVPVPKVQKALAWIVSLLLAVIYMVEFCLNESFRSFMSPQMVLSGAGGVATGFMDVVIALILGNWWKILLFLAPIALFALFAAPVRTHWELPAGLAAAGIGAGILAVIALNSCGSTDSVLSQYDFDSCVRGNGLGIAMVLEVSGAGSAQEETFTEVVVPIPMGTTPEVTEDPTEPTVPPRLHTLDVDFAGMVKGGDAVSNISAYIASQTPASTNAYTGLFAGKNLILITAEAFTAEVIDPERTPTLYRMANEGIRFTNYYQPGWNGGTTGGEVSVISGLVPRPASGMHALSDQRPFFTMGSQLQRLGYFSRAYHNNTGTFYDRTNTHTNLGYDQFMAMYSGMEEGVVNEFPQSDLEMIDFTVSQYIEHQPFSVYYMTVSGHSVYAQDQHAQARKNYHVVAELPYSEPVKCYLAANMELEYAMESLLRQLEEAGIADDTVVVISADHYPYGLDAGSAWGHQKNYVSELFGIADGYDCITRDHNALIIWSGCLEGKNITVDTPTYSLDILPTLSNLFDVEYDSRLFVGRDVFSDTMPLVLWPNYSWVTCEGRYSSETGIFTPNEGVTVSEDYINAVSALVKNKISYSHSALTNYYFVYLQKAMNTGK